MKWAVRMCLIADSLPVFGLKNLVSGFVISVKFLGLKFVRYIAGIGSFAEPVFSRRYLDLWVTTGGGLD